MPANFDGNPSNSRGESLMTDKLTDMHEDGQTGLYARNVQLSYMQC